MSANIRVLTSVFIAGALFNLGTVKAGTEMQISPAPVIKAVDGKTEDLLDPTLYPKFKEGKSDNPACCDYLAADYPNGMSGAPLWTPSTKGDGTKPLEADPGYQTIDGLVLTLSQEDIPEQYRNTAKLMVNWTVRLEVDSSKITTLNADVWKVWPRLCHPFHGTIDYSFPSGNISTTLYVCEKSSPADADYSKETAMEPQATLTIPSSPDAGKVNNPRDPTISGSIMIDPSKFSFPLQLKVKWYNKTSMPVKSLANMRNLIVTIMPITKDS